MSDRSTASYEALRDRIAVRYTGGLRRAAKLLDAELGKVMEQEREYGG